MRGARLFSLDTIVDRTYIARAAMAEVPEKPKVKSPTFLAMAKDAIESLDDKKGSSVKSIQNYIQEKYSVDIQEGNRHHLKAALAKGLSSEVFVRPKGSESVGFTGRFKLNKVKLDKEQKDKEKAQKTADKKKKMAAKPTEEKAAKKKTAVKKTALSPAKKAAKKATVVKKKSPAKKPTVKTSKALLKTPKSTPKKPKSKK